MLPRTGIILINYKDYARRFLTDLRDSLRRLEYPRDRYAVYIVDNATTPETAAYLRAQYPEAVVIPEATNAGWGGGNNRGIDRALADGCDAVVLLNMDTIVEPTWLRELTAAAVADARIGVVQSMLLLHPVPPDGIPRVNSLGNIFHYLGFGYALAEGTRIPNEPGDIRNIPYASGASMFVTGAMLQRVGWCNEELFMYHDDLELCLRAKLAGFRVVLAPASVCWHKYEFSRSVRGIEFMERNRHLVLFECLKIPTLVVLAPALLVVECGIVVAAILRGYLRAKLRGWVYFLRRRSWRLLWIMRRRIQRDRVIGDRMLLQDAAVVVTSPEAPGVATPLLARIANPIMRAYWAVARRLIWW